MSGYTQTGRPLTITTPLGEDVLLLTGFEGHEALSGLFRFQLDLIADRKTPVAFDQVLGQSVTVEWEVPPDGKRTLNGIVSRFSQGRRDAHFTHFRAELVPRLWLLTRKVQSRIFQRMTVPEILDAVLAGVPHRMEIGGSYEPRDYCTQYRESDFAFASRLMEEEGIRYYFVHADGSHEMVVSDEARRHPDVPGSEELVYDEVGGGQRDDDARITGWEKRQEVRSALTTLWDHCFELPGKNLEAQQPTIDSVTVGEVLHKVKVVPGEQLEIFDYPGGYARRFDGVGSGGAPRPEELQKIFADGMRTVRIRMEQEEMAGLEIRGTSTCRQLTAGHSFTVSRHFDADGPYYLTRVEHHARLDGDYRSGGELAFTYGNRFTALPAALPYRPPRVTPRPAIGGTQTATVVGPAGEELFCDPYGRVKVQFHWDRQGRRNLESSCWVRVAQTWAGRGWGAFFWPRAGNEVVVAFEEGDPDQPIIVGSVYNAENMPPFPLPLRKELAGFKSASVRGFANQNFNGLVFADGKGNEHLAIHSQRTMTFNSELDKSFSSGRNKHETVSTFSTFTVGSLPGGGGSGGGSPAGGETPADRGGKPSDAGGKPSGSGGKPSDAGGKPSDSGGKPPDEGGGFSMDDQKFGMTFQGNSAWHPLGFVQPTGTLGLQAAAIFGENFSLTCGLARSITLGSGLTLTINPAALSQMCGWKNPSILEAIGGTGAGGSATFTIGTNTNFVLGTTYNISLEKAKEIELANSTAAKIVAVLLGVWSYIFVVAYGLLGWDIARTCLTILYDVVTGAMLTVLMLILAVKEGETDTWKKAWADLFKPLADVKHGGWEVAQGLAGLLGNANTVVNQLLPIGAAALGGATTFATGVADAALDAQGKKA